MVTTLKQRLVAVAVASLAACVAATLLSGCSVDTDSRITTPIDPPATTVTADGLEFAYYLDSTPGEGDAAQLEGTVVNAGGCLGISGGIIPVFPFPTTDPAALKVGDKISGVGGYSSTAPSDSDGEMVIPDACANAAGNFFIAAGFEVVNSD